MLVWTAQRVSPYTTASCLIIAAPDQQRVQFGQLSTAVADTASSRIGKCNDHLPFPCALCCKKAGAALASREHRGRYPEPVPRRPSEGAWRLQVASAARLFHDESRWTEVPAAELRASDKAGGHWSQSHSSCSGQLIWGSRGCETAAQPHDILLSSCQYHHRLPLETGLVTHSSPLRSLQMPSPWRIAPTCWVQPCGCLSGPRCARTVSCQMGIHAHTFACTEIHWTHAASHAKRTARCSTHTHAKSGSAAALLCPDR